MKIALILPGSIWFAPYIRIYTRIFDSKGYDYCIISWNREGDDTPEGIQYNVLCKAGICSASLSEYRGYIAFVIKTVKERSFDRLIVFGPQMACLLSPFLLTRFRGRYMIDYRDLSIEQRPILKQIFALTLKFSRLCAISSPGFKKYLPEYDYLISHNFDAVAVRTALEYDDDNGFNRSDGIDVLTIGGIRDYSSNIEVVSVLGNKSGIRMRFVGKSSVSSRIEDFSKENDIANISFSGFYYKDEEPSYVRTCTFLNIFYPRYVTHNSALSNRFYLSLIHRKPMIVTKGTMQGDYAEKYNLGVSVETCQGLDVKLKEFLELDYRQYVSRCKLLLNSFLEDYEKFESAVIAFAGE